jgi:hypothetical protein
MAILVHRFMCLPKLIQDVTVDVPAEKAEHLASDLAMFPLDALILFACFYIVIISNAH